MITILLQYSGTYLIQFMGASLILCLIFRAIAYYSNKRNDGYFSTMAREINVLIEKDKEEKTQVSDIENYLNSFLSRVSDKLPNRSLRFKKSTPQNPKSGTGKMISIDGYLSGRENFVNILKSESGIFKLQTPPNFSELTHRILGQDPNWTNILKRLPLEGISRIIDIMPGLFVVFGVFGTFVGISMALPEIANIDFNNIETSGETLAAFVTKTAYAMETSLAGIVFSVVMTVMNSLFPIKDVRQRIVKKVETSLQTLWYHVHFSVKNEDKLAQALLAINETLREISSQNKLNQSKNGKGEAA
jgi:hypothetical protein